MRLEENMKLALPNKASTIIMALKKRPHNERTYYDKMIATSRKITYPTYYKN